MSEQTLDVPSTVKETRLDRGSIFFVGTATTLIRCGGITLLTDPNFLHAGDHVHLGYGLMSRRVTNPALEIEALPPLDLCLLSHLHGDHWDRVATAKLRKDLPVVTTPHGAAGLRRRGFKATRGLRTWQSIRVTKGGTNLKITSMPGRHGPRLVSKLLPPVMGSMLEWGAGPAADVQYRMYISGDTLVYDDLREIPERYPDIDLALLHLGGTRVLGILVTMDAEQGIQALRIIGPRLAIPIHYDDYTVFKSSLREFMRAVEKANLESKVHYLHHGESYEFDVHRAAAPNARAVHDTRRQRAAGR